MTAMTVMTILLPKGTFSCKILNGTEKATHSPSRNPNEKRKNQKKAGPMALLVI